MSVGNGTEYLTGSVANGDCGAPNLGDELGLDPVTAYYTAVGTPPGYWLGSGVADLGGGVLVQGDRVTTTQLQRLLEAGRDPVTTEPLGRAYPKIVPLRERIENRAAALDPNLSPADRKAAVDAIVRDETLAGKRTAVAGFDLTFSPAKSVSVLWGLSDRNTQAIILGAHRAAMAETIKFIEEHIAATRMGTDAGDGSIMQVDVSGVIATAYDHWDSRAHDPQLHTHLVIANKVRALVDGKWRTLDSRALFNANVAFSEHYNAVLADRLTGALGLKWERRVRGKDCNPRMEIVGVSDELIEEFSNRSAEIEHCADQLIDDYREKHGRTPAPGTINRLREQATLETRPPKTIESLADLSTQWQERAARILGQDPTAWAQGLLSAALAEPGRVFTSGDVPQDVVDMAASVVLGVVGDKRATWKHWNLWAEAERQTMHWRMATHHDRVQVVARIVAQAEGGSVTLTPPELAPTPLGMQRADGSSTLRPKHSTVFTSQAVLDAEKRLLGLMGDHTAPALGTKFLRAVLDQSARDCVLDPSQAEAITAVAGSGRRLDLLVGPAGTGKTTTLRALRTLWEGQHGPGTVVGLAPSAAAADVLGTELGIECENTAMWLTRHHHDRAQFTAGQLVIVDEASLAGTHTLDRLTRAAVEAGAKVLLVGDPAQLPAVETGGALTLLTNERARTTGDVPTLTEVHRFHAPWEKHATLRLRDGDPGILTTYQEHGRIQAGTTEDMTDAAYAAWKSDTEAGLSSVLVVPDTATMNELNRRARAERVLTGRVSDGRMVRLVGQTRASAGDLILTRRNDRTLRHGHAGWVRNGDRWQITTVHDDGSATAQRIDPDAHTDARNAHRQQLSGQTVRLPAAYVAEHVDLGYAITAHRAQGLTVDTAYTVASPSMSRENLYVALTRGRVTNTVFVPVDQPDRNHNHEHAIGADIDPDLPDLDAARTVLAGILHRVGAEPSAHQTRHDEKHRWGSIAQLAAEYDAIATHAQRPRWTHLIAHALAGKGFTRRDIAQVVESDAFGPLCAELRRAEADGHDVYRLLPRIAATRSLYDADDIAAVLHDRLGRAATRTPTSRNRVAGLIPQAQGQFSQDVREALDRRAELIERRASTLVAQALRERHPWTRHLPRRRPGTSGREWRDAAIAVAAYRERHGVIADSLLGDPPSTLTQREDARRVRTYVENLASVSYAPDARTDPDRAPGAALG
ncbi:MobF family relaxase [Promicromonospora sp. NPDC050249]|uniref:MobF family relaxase n=1 Tax=Promicromonospora sp. NPDC050249 TaxID=3154743 RepID=UPI003406570F